MACDLTAFQEKILFAIASFPSQNLQNDGPKGLAIKRELEQTYYGEEINHGRFYPNLDTLVDRGLVAKGQDDRRTNWYSLTVDGKEYCQTLLLEFGDAWENVAPDVDGDKVVVSYDQVASDASDAAYSDD